MGETRQQVDADGKPIPMHGPPAGCIGWIGGFGTYLRQIFDPKCGTTLAFSKRFGDGKPGNQGLIYRFSTPPEGCFPPSFANFAHAYPAHEGTVLVQIPGGNMISLDARSVRFPKAYPISEIEETVIWDLVKVGDEAHLLPVSYDKVMLLGLGAAQRVSAKIHQPPAFRS